MIKVFRYLVLAIIFIFLLNNDSLLKYCAQAKGIEYLEIEPDVFVFKVDPNERGVTIEPFVARNLTTVNDIKNMSGDLDNMDLLIVNASYFDPKNEKTISYIIKDGQKVCDPQLNDRLMENESLKPYLQNILKRSELRVYKNRNKVVLDIVVSRDEKPLGKHELQHSIQAGPFFYPELNLEKEFFILKEKDKIIRESVSILHKNERTFVGIKNNCLYIIIVGKNNAMDVYNMQKLAKKLKLEKAMNFDGGSSTSILFMKNNKKEFQYLSTQRKLKSFLVVKQKR